MPVQIVSQDIIMLPEPGGNPDGNPYVHLKLDNGYTCNIPTSDGDDVVAAAIQKVVDDFNSENPPTNWKPDDE